MAAYTCRIKILKSKENLVYKFAFSSIKRFSSTWNFDLLKTKPCDDPPEVRLWKTMAPFQEYIYSDQLEKKQTYSNRCSHRLGNYLLNCTARPSEELCAHIHKLDGNAYPVESIRPSPVQDEYRNKDSFTIGRGCDGQPTVGYFLLPGKFPHLNLFSGTIKPQKYIHFEISKIFQDFLRSQSCLPPWNHSFNSGGFWQSLVVRSNREGHLMIVGVINPSSLSQRKLLYARDQFMDLFINGRAKTFQCDSLYFQERLNMRTASGSVDHLLHGESHLYEELCGYKFRISPRSFFQLNPFAAEVLYKAVGEDSGLSKNTVLLDICSGTGTIGIIYSNQVKRIIGIEENITAVEDAKFNSEINGVRNATWIVGRAEKMLNTLINDYINGEDDVLAVVNPGRAGLGEKVVKAIRNCASIKKVIYISCNPSGVAQFNLARFCQSENTKRKLFGKPFLTVKAVPVDMFPHCKHQELVIWLER